MKKIILILSSLLMLGVGCKNDKTIEALQKQTVYLTERVYDLEAQIDNLEAQTDGQISEVSEVANEAFDMIVNLCGELDRC